MIEKNCFVSLTNYSSNTMSYTTNKKKNCTMSYKMNMKKNCTMNTMSY
jgi:hypothetical protein